MTFSDFKDWLFPVLDAFVHRIRCLLWMHDWDPVPLLKRVYGVDEVWGDDDPYEISFFVCKTCLKTKMFWKDLTTEEASRSSNSITTTGSDNNESYVTTVEINGSKMKLTIEKGNEDLNGQQTPIITIVDIIGRRSTWEISTHEDIQDEEKRIEAIRDDVLDALSKVTAPRVVILPTSNIFDDLDGVLGTGKMRLGRLGALR